MRSLLACVAAAAALLAQPAAVQSAPAQPAMTAGQSVAAIDRALTNAAAKGFGGAIIIEQSGKTFLSKGYGFADRERRIPFTPETVAQIGSVTKSQTAAALVTLIAEGKVKLSDPVSKFIPEAPEPGRSRTIAQLASHSSGLLDSCTDDFEPQSEAMLISTCLARPLEHPVGEDHYSNMGYSVLALIVQRVTGKSWEEALRDRVWAPLGMKEIGFYFRGVSDDQFSRGYLKNVEQPVISREIVKLHGSDWALRGNGGIQASSKTMIQFLDGILDPNGGFPPAARKILLSPVPGQSGEVQEGFGLAFRYEADGTPIRVGHAGSDGTFFSYLGWLRKNDVRIYLVGNNGADEVQPLVQMALKQALQIPPAAGAK
ncbi:MAG TPA: serine hydrolase domain-containing protein [Sphingomicrobium sp.]|jgi:CubicO group peptidase (beta-lactamase class C family)|nr:serine hydrolase domain-containing protein [Sphingomicrobium sp.]